MHRRSPGGQRLQFTGESQVKSGSEVYQVIQKYNVYVHMYMYMYTYTNAYDTVYVYIYIYIYMFIYTCRTNTYSPSLYVYGRVYFVRW